MLVSTLYTFLPYPSSTRVPLNWILFCLALRCESQFTSPDERCISLEGTVCLYWELYIAKRGVHCCTTWNKVPFAYQIPHFYLLRSRSLSPCPCCTSLFYTSYALWTMFQSYFRITRTGVQVPISLRPGAFFTDQSSCLRFCNCLPVRCVQHILVLISLVWWYRCLLCPTAEDWWWASRLCMLRIRGFSLLINVAIPSTDFQQTNDCTHTNTTFILRQPLLTRLISIPSCHTS